MESYEGMIIIHNDLYNFDESGPVLNSADGQTKLKFSDLEKEGENYVGYYDPVAKTFNQEGEATTPFINYWWQFVCIPIELVERSKNLRPGERFKFNSESIKNERGFYIVDRDLSNRLLGKLPTVNIDGITYTIDIEHLEIRQQQDTDKKFTFSDQVFSSIQYGFYNTTLKEPCSIDHRITEFPSDIVCFNFPSLYSYDPVGFHLLDPGRYDLGVVTQRDWQQVPEQIKVIPLHETIVAELVRRNQVEQETHSSGINGTAQDRRIISGQTKRKQWKI